MAVCILLAVLLAASVSFNVARLGADRDQESGDFYARAACGMADRLPRDVDQASLSSDRRVLSQLQALALTAVVAGADGGDTNELVEAGEQMLRGTQSARQGDIREGLERVRASCG